MPDDTRDVLDRLRKRIAGELGALSNILTTKRAVETYLEPYLSAGDTHCVAVAECKTHKPGNAEVVDMRTHHANQVVEEATQARTASKYAHPIVIIVDMAPSKTELQAKLDARFTRQQLDSLKMDVLTVVGTQLPGGTPRTELPPEARDVLPPEEPGRDADDRPR